VCGRAAEENTYFMLTNIFTESKYDIINCILYVWQIYDIIYCILFVWQSGGRENVYLPLTNIFTSPIYIFVYCVCGGRKSL